VPCFISLLLIKFKYKHLSLKEFISAEKDDDKVCDELSKVYRDLSREELIKLGRNTLF
jgi:hypothetical protein